jgi:hypothetical protein
MASRVSCGVLDMHISFDMLASLARQLLLEPGAADEADQTGKPDETRDDKEMAGTHMNSRRRPHPGGDP